MHLILDRNNLDIQLYQYAIQLFERRVDLLHQTIERRRIDLIGV